MVYRHKRGRFGRMNVTPFDPQTATIFLNGLGNFQLSFCTSKASNSIIFLKMKLLQSYCRTVLHMVFVPIFKENYNPVTLRFLKIYNLVDFPVDKNFEFPIFGSIWLIL